MFDPGKPGVNKRIDIDWNERDLEVSFAGNPMLSNVV